MKDRSLTGYKNITDWALRAYPPSEDCTLAHLKDLALDELNEKFSTNYQRRHIDNWLAERKPVPKAVLELWRDSMIEVEVEEKNPELGRQLRRLMKK